MIIKLFFDHPRKVCMTYLQHFRFSMKLSSIFFISSIKAFIHALFPFWCVTSTTDAVTYIQNQLKSVGCVTD